MPKPDDQHLLALALVILELAPDGKLLEIVDEQFDSQFLSSGPTEQQILETAFRDRAYAIELARTALS